MKPMLAEEGVLGKIAYPKAASFKLNGVRGLVPDVTLMARSLKPIPNKHTSQLFSGTMFRGLDSELVVGPYGAEDVFSQSTSGVMSVDGTPDVRMYVFDDFSNPGDPFMARVDRMLRGVEAIMKIELFADRVVPVYQKLVHSDDEVKEMEAIAVGMGYEGIVLRDPHAPYKFGRSTQLEGGFLRYVPWQYSEATLLEVIEGETNTNPQTKNELGYAKRSLAKGGMVKTGTAGAIRVRDLKTNVEFSIALGTVKECAWFWEHRLEVVGRLVKYRYKRSVKTAPRFPQLEGFRDPLDMSE